MTKEEKKIFKFTLEKLQTIISKNLMLFQYYDHLYPLLRANYTNNNNDHNTQLQKNKNVQKGFLSVKQYFTNNNNNNSSNNNRDSLAFQPLPFPIASLIVYSSLVQQQPNRQSYPYQFIQQCINSYKFIQTLPAYVNSLLTTTNIGIVRQTLKIYMLLQSNIQRANALHRIKNIVNTLTLYQIQRNVTQIDSSLQQLNKIFQKIGLICTKQQHLFYYQHVWVDVQQQEVKISQGADYRTYYTKYLQIYDILPLAVQLEQIRTLKCNLRQWIGSQQFLKYYNINKNKNKVKNRHQRYHSNSIKSSNSIKDQCFTAGEEQNFNILKLKIQYMGTRDLLEEIQRSKYDMEKHNKKFGEFKKGLLQEIQKQNEKKKVFNLLNPKSSKSLPHCSSLQKSKSSISMNSNISSMLQKYKPRSNRQKQQQQAFNKKVLNGFYIREQIKCQIQQGSKQFLTQQPVSQKFKQLQNITLNLNLNLKNKQSKISNCSKNTNNKPSQRLKLISRKKCIKFNQSSQIKTGKQLQNKTKKEIGMENKSKSRIQKLTSINVSYSEIQFKQNKVYKQNYFDKLLSKVTNQKFYQLGNKIFYH